LRKASADRLPAWLLNQKKAGFNAPVSHWLLGPLRELAQRATASDALAEWLEPAAVEQLWREHEARRRDNGLALFGLTCLGLWLERRP
jgi:asparagine synthase (glutamine-hydrolysing)